jgi:hypothetical protein
MTHEWVHMGFPNLSQDHHWLEEGIATCIEPVARVQAGALTLQKAQQLRNERQKMTLNPRHGSA